MTVTDLISLLSGKPDERTPSLWDADPPDAEYTEDLYGNSIVIAVRASPESSTRHRQALPSRMSS
jgi:hypothetical protein